MQAVREMLDNRYRSSDEAPVSVTQPCGLRTSRLSPKDRKPFEWGSGQWVEEVKNNRMRSAARNSFKGTLAGASGTTEDLLPNLSTEAKVFLELVHVAKY